MEKSKAGRKVACEYRQFDAIANQTTGDEVREKAMHYASVVGDVEDVIQATDLQASCVAFSTYKEERRGINWLLCDFVLPLDERVIHRICECLTTRHATLRTFFMAHRRALYQVVSKSFQPQSRTHLNLKDIHETTECLMEDDLQSREVDMTQPQTTFELLSCSDATRIERLIIRISAAQYDGHSVAILGREMNFLINNIEYGHVQLRELNGSYPAYLHYARAMEIEQGIEYWRSLLAGADMTEITKRNSPSGDNPSNLNFVDGVLVSTFETRLLELATINSNTATNKLAARSTRATIAKTAWALTLAELTGRDDVVFASTGWGRNNPVEFAQDVMGSCTSHIPTRAQLKPYTGDHSPQSTYGELVEQLQAQHIASMRFENVGATTIVEKCTPWRRWTRFSSLLIFQGLDIETSQQASHGNNEPEDAAAVVKLTEIMDPGDRADIIVHVEPFGKQTRVMVAFAKKSVPEDVAGIMLRKFKQYLELTTQRTNQPIDLGDRNSCPVLPIICKIADAKGTEEQSVSDRLCEKAKAIVKEVWTDILDVETHKVRENESFFEIWGNPVSAAALAHDYRKKGLGVSTEDVLRNQTVKEQIAMISSIIGA
ncbi:nonribosomal peptide synthase nlsA [Colletotrichum spaethianum]|uniref:Nonribosomal peptide synthase nlsA n=1 Tax=Colletotrichum spaethianum TaxID=700344 RepID=A0AA37LM57_9PEZI|nr:nonribosomal peptide synthase nlsA [Colletotrichum spaethianum]GKT47352.1 nonribosomal peptide synthase nlsA [Colletotrichum spaethianum]